MECPPHTLSLQGVKPWRVREDTEGEGEREKTHRERERESVRAKSREGLWLKALRSSTKKFEV